MRRQLVGCTVILVLLCGCSAERKKTSRETNQLTTAYRYKMDKGQTTPEQDKDFIRAMNDVVVQLDGSIRGLDKAAQTKADAEKALQGGNDPTAKILDTYKSGDKKSNNDLGGGSK